MAWVEVPMLETVTHLGSNPDVMQLFLPKGIGKLTCLAQFLICKVRVIKSSYVTCRSK